MCYERLLLAFCVWLFFPVLMGAEQQYLITESQLKNIEALVEKSELDRQNWESQARGLRNKAENLESEAASLNAQLAQERIQYWNLERSFNRLEANKSRENQEKDTKILNLTESNVQLWKAVFIMSGIIGAVLVYLIVRLVLWIKSGAAASLIKSFFRRAT